MSYFGERDEKCCWGSGDNPRRLKITRQLYRVPGAEEKALGSSGLKEARAHTREASLIWEHEFSYIFQIPIGESGHVPTEQLENQHCCRQLGAFRKKHTNPFNSDSREAGSACLCPDSLLMEGAWLPPVKEVNCWNRMGPSRIFQSKFCWVDVKGNLALKTSQMLCMHERWQYGWWAIKP